MAKIFDTARDNQQIAAGTHFYCHGHLTAVPIAERSRDGRYCRECLAIIESDRRNNGPADYWEENGQVFVAMGKRYGITATGKTTCMSPVKGLQEVDDRPLAVGGGVQRGVAMGVTALPSSLIPSSQNVTDKCPICGGIITDKRADSVFCSNACKQKFYRMKNKQLVLV